MSKIQREQDIKSEAMANAFNEILLILVVIWLNKFLKLIIHLSITLTV